MYFRVLLASVFVVSEINKVALHWISSNLVHCSSDGSPIAVFHSLYFVLFCVVLCCFVLFSVVCCSLEKVGVVWCSLMKSGMV